VSFVVMTVSVAVVNALMDAVETESVVVQAIEAVRIWLEPQLTDDPPFP